MTQQEKNKIENLLINRFKVSEDCINFATGIYGENEETYHNLLYYFTGYNSIDQIEDEEEDVYQVMITHQDYLETLHFLTAKSIKQLEYKISKIDPYYIDYSIVSKEQ